MVSITLLPESDVAPHPSGGWMAFGPEPWLAAPGLERLAGQWVRLHYRQGPFDEAIRPVMRVRLADGGELRIPLNGAPYGASRWSGRMPDDVIGVAFCPVRRAGPFGFELADARAVSRLRLVIRGLLREPAMAMTAIGARLIGARAEARHCLAFAATATSPRRFRQWRTRGVAGFAPSQMAVPEEAAMHILLRRGEVAAVARTRTSLEANRYPSWRLWPLDEEASGEPLIRELGRPDDWVTVLDAGDELLPDALAQIAVAAARQPCTAVIGDEEAGDEYRPRPEWCALNGPVSGAFVRLSALPAGWRVPDVSESADLIGRMSDPKVVTLFRPLRRCRSLAVQQTPAALSLGDPFVTVVIPFRNQPALLKTCLAGLAKTAGRLEIVLVDNGSTDPMAIGIATDAARSGRATLLRQPGPFNYAALCNAGAAAGRAPLILFLNNDVEPREPDWLRRLAVQAETPEVGAVGARLLFPNGRLQHGGVVVGMGGTALHLNRGGPNRPDRWQLTSRPRRTGAVTGAVLMVERAKFDAVGGFDAEAFPVLLNDIDLCLRLAQRGWHSFYEPRAVLIHRESASRGRGLRPLVTHAAERARFQARWPDAIRHDPGFHPALSLWSIPPALG